MSAYSYAQAENDAARMGHPLSHVEIDAIVTFAEAFQYLAEHTSPRMHMLTLNSLGYIFREARRYQWDTSNITPSS